MQVLSAKSLLPPSRGLPALQSTWVSKTATSRFSTLFNSFSNHKLALVLHVVFLHPRGGPGQDSCTECQPGASQKGKAKESSVTGDLLFRPWETTSTKCFQFFLFVSQNRKQTTSSVQPIRSLIELDLLFLWFPQTSTLIMKVEVAFNTGGRNMSCTIPSSWESIWPFPSQQPSQQALCKAHNNFPGAPELSAHVPNTNSPLMDSRVSQRQIFSGSTQGGVWDGSQVAARHAGLHGGCSPTKPQQEQQSRSNGGSQDDLRAQAARQAPSNETALTSWGRAPEKWGKVWVKTARHKPRHRYKEQRQGCAPLCCAMDASQSPSSHSPGQGKCCTVLVLTSGMDSQTHWGGRDSSRWRCPWAPRALVNHRRSTAAGKSQVVIHIEVGGCHYAGYVIIFPDNSSQVISPAISWSKRQFVVDRVATYLKSTCPKMYSIPSLFYSSSFHFPSFLFSFLSVFVFSILFWPFKGCAG